MKEPTTQEADIAIDFPKEGEVVDSPDYTFRISAAEVSSVEISIDGLPWQACRQEADYWWFDWSGYTSGPHEIEAHGIDAEGDLIRTSCEFRVKL